MDAQGEALLFGHGGLLARELVVALRARAWGVRAVTRECCDITNSGAVRALIDSARPRLIVNCAAYTKVDQAEREAGLAFAVNASGAGIVAQAAASVGARLLHISTDYVFDGKGDRPYREEDPIGPLGVYARSKSAGELAVATAQCFAYIVRTGELYGDGGHHFFSAIERRAREGSRIRVVADQTVSPTWTRELSAQLAVLVESAAPAGIYHATASGEATWYEAARHALKLMGFDADCVEPVSTEEYASPTPRPRYSVLAHTALSRYGLYEMRSWSEALAQWISGRDPSSA